MRLLIVEDDPVIAMTAAAVLTSGGHEVVGEAYTAQDALDQAAGTHPELALVDINLAGHDEGIALARDLTARFAIPSMFVSGQLASAHANRDAALGLLRKPYDPASLLSSIDVAQAMLAGDNPPPPRVPHTMEIYRA